MMTLKHDIVGYTESGEFKLRFKDEFPTIVFTLGKVEFVEEGDGLRMKYNYDILEGKLHESKKPMFERLIGDLIVQQLEEGVKKNDLIYTGGVDAN